MNRSQKDETARHAQQIKEHKEAINARIVYGNNDGIRRC